MVDVKLEMLLVGRIDRSPFILAVVVAGRVDRAPGRCRSSSEFSMSSTMFWSWTVMLKSNGVWMPPGMHLGPGRLGRAADLHRELEGLAILGPAACRPWSGRSD